MGWAVVAATNLIIIIITASHGDSKRCECVVLLS